MWLTRTRLTVAAGLFAALFGPAAAQDMDQSAPQPDTVRIRMADPDIQIFQVFIDRRPVTALYRRDNEIGLDLPSGGNGPECRHDLAIVTSDGRLADLPGTDFCTADGTVTVDTASLSGGTTRSSSPAGAASAARIEASSEEGCGWLAIMACQSDAAAAERDSTRIMGGVSVIATDQYQGLEPGLYCAAQGPYATEAEAEQTAGFFRAKGAPDAYTRQACEAAPPAPGQSGAEPPPADDAAAEAAEDTEPAQHLALEPGWNFVPPSPATDNVAMLAYADDQSDSWQLLASCAGGSGIALAINLVPEGAAAGSPVETTLATEGFRQRFPAAVSGDGESVVVSTTTADPLWRALIRHNRLEVRIDTLDARVLPLRGSSLAVRPFVESCGRARATPGGPDADADADADAGAEADAEAGADAEAVPAPAGAVRYACEGGPALQVFFDRSRKRAVVSVDGAEPMALDRVASGSGALFRSGDFALHYRGGSDATWAGAGGNRFSCRGR